MDKDAAGIEGEFAAPPDNAVRAAIAFQNPANNTRTLDLTNRYETRFHRQFMRALNELKDLQDRRLPVACPPAPDAPGPVDVLPNEANATTPEAAEPLAAAALPNEPKTPARSCQRKKQICQTNSPATQTMAPRLPASLERARNMTVSTDMLRA